MQLIVCTFSAAARAEEVKDIIEQIDAQLDTIKLGNIAIVQKAEDGQISFRETRDIRNELSEIAGIVAGGVAWLAYAITGSFGGPASQMAGLGAENAVAARLKDRGFLDEALHEVGERLSAGESALITLVRAEEEPVVIKELERLGGTIVTQALSHELATELTDKP